MHIFSSDLLLLFYLILWFIVNFQGHWWNWAQVSKWWIKVSNICNVIFFELGKYFSITNILIGFFFSQTLNRSPIFFQIILMYSLFRNISSYLWSFFQLNSWKMFCCEYLIGRLSVWTVLASLINHTVLFLFSYRSLRLTHK